MQHAFYQLHSWEQLDDSKVVEALKWSKVIIGNTGLPFERIRAIAPDAKILPTYNAHMMPLYGQDNADLIEFRTKVVKYILNDENLNPIRSVDWPEMNYEFRYSAALARDLAKAIVEMNNKYPVDGLYLDDFYGLLPARYSVFKKYYTPISMETRWKNYRENLVKEIRRLLGPDKVFICNTAGALAKGASGISVEEGHGRQVALDAFKKQGGFWNIYWSKTQEEIIEIENSNLRVLNGKYGHNIPG